MKLPEIIETLAVPRRTIYSWMDKHPNVSEQDDKSLLGHPFPKPTHKEGRENVWDDATVHRWWDDNCKTVGRHPLEPAWFDMPMSRYLEVMRAYKPSRWTDDATGDERVEDDMLLVQQAEQMGHDSIRLTFRNASDAVLFKLKHY